MEPEISRAEAEAVLLTQPIRVGGSYLWRLSRGVGDGDDLLHGLTRRRLAELLGVGQTRSWQIALAPADAEIPPHPFGPAIVMGNTRSFAPGDLTAEEEPATRVLATASKNAVVRAVLFDVLWVRFRSDHRDAREAIDARIASAELRDLEEAWPEAVFELARACQLASNLGDGARIASVVLPAIYRMGLAALRSSEPAFFVGIANELAHVALLNRKISSQHSGSLARTWATTCALVAADLQRRGDPFRAEDALSVAALLLGEAPTEARAIRELRSEWMFARAFASEPLAKAALLGEIMQDATDHGFTGLLSRAKALQPHAIREATSSMKGVAVDIRLPEGFAEVVHQLLARAPHAADAVRALARLEFLTRLPVGASRATAETEAEHTLLFRLIGSMQFRDGKVAAQASSAEEKNREAFGRYAGLHLAQCEMAAEHFLRLGFARFAPDTLVSALHRPGWIDARHIPWLTRASERFHAQDFLSSGAIVLTQYEGVLRELARAAGHHALKFDGGLTQDETLNSLLRVEAVRQLLGEDHVVFVEHVLCRPEMGPNLRNELAHGNLEVHQLTPGRVLLMWLLLARLCSFDRASSDDASAQASASASTNTQD